MVTTEVVPFLQLVLASESLQEEPRALAVVLAVDTLRGQLAMAERTLRALAARATWTTRRAQAVMAAMEVPRSHPAKAVVKTPRA
jgi:hypothetical protein